MWIHNFNSVWTRFNSVWIHVMNLVDTLLLVKVLYTCSNGKWECPEVSPSSRRLPSDFHSDLLVLSGTGGLLPLTQATSEQLGGAVKPTTSEIAGASTDSTVGSHLQGRIQCSLSSWLFHSPLLISSLAWKAFICLSGIIRKTTGSRNKPSFES